jgi:peptide chain release factor
MKQKIYLQITSGRGPIECCRVVFLVLQEILRQATEQGVTTEILYCEQGTVRDTLFSVTLSMEGEGYEELANQWKGTIQWIAQSPYRPHHKRKNWFVGINTFVLPPQNSIAEKEIIYQTLRAPGPGGQHVNKVESAVRATHIPTGISVIADERRSQLQNKKLATERLLVKLETLHLEQVSQVEQVIWNNHNQLQRGNPVKVIQEKLK